MSGASFGINYDGALLSGVDIYSWSLCADSELPTAGWPSPGTGNTISFTTPERCQTGGNAGVGGVATLGYFYCAAYTPGTTSLTKHPETNQNTVTDCGGVVDVLPSIDDPGCTWLGTVAFGGFSGVNPCGRGAGAPGCQPIGSCSFDGPAVVTAGQTGIRYDGGAVNATNTWSITGNGTIVGSTHDLHVIVDAGAPGSFTLRLRFSYGPQDLSECVQVIPVQDPVPAVPLSWGRIKNLSVSR